MIEGQGIRGTSIPLGHARILTKLGLIVKNNDMSTGYWLTDSGSEYIYRAYPYTYSTFQAPPPYIVREEKRMLEAGESVGRERFLHDWDFVEEDIDRIRKSPEPLDGLDVDKIIKDEG